MQHQHSCGTLESRIQIFRSMVQELYITFFPSGLLSLATLGIKGV